VIPLVKNAPENQDLQENIRLLFKRYQIETVHPESISQFVERVKMDLLH
jgi:hypothetical protein